MIMIIAWAMGYVIILFHQRLLPASNCISLRSGLVHFRLKTLADMKLHNRHTVSSGFNTCINTAHTFRRRRRRMSNN